MLEKSFEKIISNSVPQLRNNGLSADYTNEFAAINTGVSIYHANPEMSPEIMKIFREKVQETGKLIHYYEQRFPQTTFSNVINEKNRKAIEKIDGLATKCNEQFLEIDNNKDLNEVEKLKEISQKILPEIIKIQHLIEDDEQLQAS